MRKSSLRGAIVTKQSRFQVALNKHLDRHAPFRSSRRRILWFLLFGCMEPAIDGFCKGLSFKKREKMQPLLFSGGIRQDFLQPRKTIYLLDRAHTRWPHAEWLLARILHEYYPVRMQNIIKPPSPQSSPLKGDLCIRGIFCDFC